ncbi:MAG: hypothetical protein ABUS56_11715 [Acidobacteriota bacterium]
MMGPIRHLREDRLFECYTNERAGTLPDPRAAEHLADCPACAARYDDLRSVMDELAVEGAADADAVFTPERLRSQQLQVARRIEHVGRAARVITFPGPAGDRVHGARASHAPSPWMAGAVAAGLAMGIGLGITFEWERHGRLSARTAAALYQPAPAPPAAGATALSNATDESFLSDLDVALDRPRFRGELRRSMP